MSRSKWQLLSLLLGTVLGYLLPRVEANPIYIIPLPSVSLYELIGRLLLFAVIEGVLLASILSRNTKWLPTLSIGFLVNLVSMPSTWYIFSTLVGRLGLWAVLVAELVPVLGEFIVIVVATSFINRMRIEGVEPHPLSLLGMVCVANLITFMLGSFTYGAVSPF